MKIMHLTKILPVTDFVTKDMRYFERVTGIKPIAMSIGWSGRSKLRNALLTIMRMINAAIKIRIINPDVIHCHFVETAFAAVLSRVPAVVSVHNSSVTARPFWRAFYSVFAGRLGIIYVSHYNRECWKPYLGKEGTVIYHAIDREEYNPSLFDQTRRDSLLKELDADHILFSMGGMEPRRGLHLVVKAAKVLQQRGLRVGVVLKGYGGNPRFAEKIVRYAQKEQVACKIITEFITDETMAKLFASTDVFVRPTSVESFGIAVLEAQACGTPAVVSDCCSLKEVFRDSSLQFETGNYVALADTIQKILEQESVRKGLIEAGLANAEKLSWERKIKSYYRKYLQVAKLK